MNKFYLLFVILIISSCDRSIESLKQEEFFPQKKTYTLIVEKLSDFNKIESVEPALKFENVQNANNFDQSTIDAYNELNAMVEKLGLRKVIAIRNLETRELLGVSFVMPLQFLDWSSMQQIKYIDPKESIDSFIPPSASCDLLDPPSWYFCNYNTQ